MLQLHNEESPSSKEVHFLSSASLLSILASLILEVLAPDADYQYNFRLDLLLGS
jgi:hypothetical protein